MPSMAGIVLFEQEQPIVRDIAALSSSFLNVTFMIASFLPTDLGFVFY